ncbi:MAG: tRNA uridine-5-carboxymethylaminomethyl(34) synthesis enzyme MnmG [Candidatus Omnitrophica bacterium]|nr:tRNA uridine-5-carboxymethylaminomethyl(34) synthesis enzyme MnmG [Candidatus Omnitrophota bacterium]
MEKDFDLIVVGAGHAGAEAALSASRMGFSVLLLTMNLDTVGQMSCNPAIGGVAKGQLVREIDALGGEMGRWADATGIQFRVLNAGKGPAAFSPRVQSDKKAYQKLARETLERIPNLTIRQGVAEEVLVKGGKVAGIDTREGLKYRARSVIITAGTFLSGVLHLGQIIISGGRMGEESADKLSGSLKRNGFEVSRFKTGTPPRVSFRSLNLDKLKIQLGDEFPRPFSFRTEGFAPHQVPCYLTHTTPETIRIVTENLHRAPLYTGQITGIGPRYCPSLEVKVKRFPGKTGHQVFLEPEGRNTDEVYVGGFATSLPAEVQRDALKTVTGLEDAEILRFGYAVEYDFFPTHQIKSTMETKRVENLYFAGQVNGTSGYEEAAGQGLLAGINAGLRLQGKPPFVPRSDEAYLGVMANDLTTTELLEPYRLFTSRAEYRLLLRSDNADFRLMDYGYRFGLIPEDVYENMRSQREAIATEIKRLKATFVSLPEGALNLARYLRRPDVSYRDIEKLEAQKRKGTEVAPASFIPLPVGERRGEGDERIKEAIEIELKYEGYLEQDKVMAERLAKNAGALIPKNFKYDKIAGLSTEGREKLEKFRPGSLDEARQISGIRASDLTLLFLRLQG